MVCSCKKLQENIHWYILYKVTNYISNIRFKHYSEEKNLKEKSQYADRLREKLDQDMINYGLSHTPFAEWAVGNYGL